MGTLLRCALLPAAAIAAAVIAQPLVAVLLPAVERFHFGGLRADSYIPIVMSAVLCFGIGHWFGRRERSRRIIASLAIFPVLWLVYILCTIHALGGRSLYAYAALGYLQVAGLVPLAAIGAGWITASFRPGSAV